MELAGPVGSVTGLSEVVEHVARLLLAGGDDRHNTLGEMTSGLALSSFPEPLRSAASYH
jgi:hypothetical protein